jgi:UDP-2-acetamido-2-deoxy-ribo-hexuluronate aminotransferase
MKIDFANLQYQYQLYKKDIDEKIQKVLDKSNYIMGEEVQELEVQLSDFTKAKHVITCSNGTDALLLAMMGMDIQPGDEIITTPFTFIATAETIALMKAVPVFVDIEAETFNIDTNKIESAITNKTRIIMPVSLYGQPSDMDEINSIAKKHNLKVIIDGAQSFGATYKQKSEVHHCDIYTTSFFPAKPLGCYGDGGAVFTNNDEYAEKIKMMRVHGQDKRYHHKYIGMGGRLDTIQAAILLAKLPHYTKEIEMRQAVAQGYGQRMSSTFKIEIPKLKPDRTSVWAQYTVRVKDRDHVQKSLQENDIPTAIHYPKPLHLQECFQYLGLNPDHLPVSEIVSHEVVSLPMNPFLTDEEIEYVVEHLTATVTEPSI